MSGRKPRLVDPFYFPAKQASPSPTKTVTSSSKATSSSVDILEKLKENWLIVLLVIGGLFFIYKYFSQESKEEKELEEIETDLEKEQEEETHEQPPQQSQGINASQMRDHYYQTIPQPNGIEGFSTPGHQAYVNMLPNTLPGVMSPEASYYIQRQGPQSMQEMNQAAYSPHLSANYENSSDMQAYNANYMPSTPYGHGQYVNC